jgi:hypothetical protein
MERNAFFAKRSLFKLTRQGLQLRASLRRSEKAKEFYSVVAFTVIKGCHWQPFLFPFSQRSAAID